MKIQDAKILLIIAFKDFRDEEFMIPYEEFRKKGATVTVCSTELGIAEGMFHHKIKVDIKIDQAKSKDYNALIYVGGKGTPTVRSDEAALKLITDSLLEGKKILAAICWAPTILAKAGALKNKKATVWLGEDSEYRKKTNEVLEQFGAIHSKENVVVDGNIITGNGAEAALLFAQKIIENLETL